MCNLYSITTNQAAIIALFRVVNRYVGNLAPMPGVFPDYPAPIVRNGADGRELATARWGMPSSQFVRKMKEGETTNDLFAFLTTEPNAEVGAIHPKAMPVILTTLTEVEAWNCPPAGRSAHDPANPDKHYDVPCPQARQRDDQNRDRFE